MIIHVAPLLITIIVYLVVGMVIAHTQRSKIIARNIAEKTEYYYSIPDMRRTPRTKTELDRRNVLFQYRAMIFGWLIYLPIFFISASLNQAMDKVDPAVHAAQAKRIAELEHELEMES